MKEVSTNIVEPIVVLGVSIIEASFVLKIPYSMI